MSTHAEVQDEETACGGVAGSEIKGSNSATTHESHGARPINMNATKSIEPCHILSHLVNVQARTLLNSSRNDEKQQALTGIPIPMDDVLLFHVGNAQLVLWDLQC